MDSGFADLIGCTTSNLAPNSARVCDPDLFLYFLVGKQEGCVCSASSYVELCCFIQTKQPQRMAISIVLSNAYIVSYIKAKTKQWLPDNETTFLRSMGNNWSERIPTLKPSSTSLLLISSGLTWGSSTTSLLLISPGPAEASNFFVRVQLTSLFLISPGLWRHRRLGQL